ERAMQMRTIAADERDRDDLSDELNKHLNDDESVDEDFKVQEARERGRKADECHGKAGEIFSGMKPGEDAKKAAIRGSGEGHARITEQDCKYGREGGPED